MVRQHRALVASKSGSCQQASWRTTVLVLVPECGFDSRQGLYRW